MRLVAHDLKKQVDLEKHSLNLKNQKEIIFRRLRDQIPGCLNGTDPVDIFIKIGNMLMIGILTCAWDEFAGMNWQETEEMET